MKDDLISIIVPIYNGEKYLKVCLESIIKQTYQNIEIILVDDGSTDNSIVICNRYAKLDSRVNVINKKNTGVSNSRNIGLLKATGDYICFIDCDDYIELTMVEELHKCIVDNNADIVRCKMRIFNRIKNINIENFYELNDKMINSTAVTDILYHFITSKENIGCYVMPLLIKKNKAVVFNEKLTFMEDTEFYVRLLLNDCSIFFYDKDLYYYRYNESSVSKKSENAKKNIFGALNSIICIKKTLTEEGLLTETLEKEINNHFINVTFTRLKLNSNLNLKEQVTFLRGIFSNKELNKIFNNTNKNNLTIIKKLEIILIKLKQYLFLAIVLKITAMKCN